MNGDPVWHEVIGWLLVATALYGVGYVALLVIDTARVAAGIPPLVTNQGKTIADASILCLFFLLFYFVMGAVRP